MTRKLSVLFVLALFVMSLGSAAFAAKANPGSHSKPAAGLEATALRTTTSTDDYGNSAATSEKPTPNQPTALGYYMAGEVQVGSTDFDWQSNIGRQQRQVTIGTDNRLHAVWMNRLYAGPAQPDPANPRNVFYSGFIPGVTDPSAAWTMSPNTGGYGSIAVGQGDDRAVAAYHYTKAAAPGHSVVDTRSRAAIGRQAGEFSFTFGMYDYPSSDTIMPNILNCQGIKTGLGTIEGGYIWPSIAADNNGTATIAHVLAREYLNNNTSPQPRDTTGKASLVYWKTLPNAAFPGTYTCGFLMDSVASTICYDIVATPGSASNKVAAVYLYPKVWTGYDLGDNDDLVYRESNNMGDTWGDRTLIRSFDSQDSIVSGGMVLYERPEEVSALYDDNNDLHVLYETYWAGVNPADGLHYYQIYPARIYHWTSQNPTCNVMLKDAKARNDVDVAAWWPSTGRPPLGQHMVAKVNLTQCTVGSAKRLYAVYILYPDSSGIEGNTYSDRSATPVLNGDVVAQGSTDLTGSSWGPVVNISNTRSDGCAVGLCFSEGYSNAAIYTSDSLRIEYLIDKDAGSGVQGTSTNNQGVLTDNPVVVKGYPCFTVSTESILASSPSAVVYPFHAKKNATATQVLTLINDGNEDANWTSSTIGGTGWISLPGSGVVPSGCTRTSTVTVTAGPKSTEGLFKATVRFTYDSPAKTLDVPIDFYVFDSWFLPQDVAIRTASNKMMVNQAGQAADDITGSSWTYFADPSIDYITDASLIMGNSAQNLSWLIFKDGQAAPSPTNNYGKLYALSNTDYDTTTFTSYRVARGKGTNRDSTVGFDVNWYAAKHVDSADFYIGHFEVYKGVKNPSGTETGVDIAFACDWDVPSDTSSDNSIGTDPSRQMIYLQGQYSADRQRGFAALAAYRESDLVPPTLTAITGGFAWGNMQQVYDQSGYQVDSVWKYMQATANYNSPWSDGDSIGDMSIVMVIAKNYSVTPTSRLKFDVIIAAKRAETNGDGLDGLNLAVDKGKAFITRYTECSACGDANSDGSVDISDVVYLIAHIFSGGAAPAWCTYVKGKGDANGDGSVDISDAVYLIARIFSGGKPPHCQGK